MTNPYTPMPPAPRPADTRPLYRRPRVWAGGSGLFIAGALIAATGNGGQQPAAEIKSAPAATITVTATPEPGPTVTETIKAKAKPQPTVTVTKTARAQVADTNSSSGSDSGSDTTGTCSIVSSSGNCYSAGQFCRNSDHGASTTTASGARIKCVYSSNAWRWTYS
ncbi:hypothetical protein [Streptomyces acidicola]|uniref:Uncharacterized protein n=1 Tax=Streptomyces acidicola TaxID=2596892 RepID=A0A5N8WKF8_9ACTN|nr:hypothetical protein [Streptomyces acidicola]MPY47187.1 hypothetical protein [Streptomyces acidicola]MPY47326.1 hypothetical protein [Streptomyces acidicola]